MAAIVVNRGLQVIGGRASNTADAFLEIDTMAVDTSATGFVAGDTTLGSPATVFAQLFDATPTRSGQVISHVMTIAAANGVMTIKRISLHNTTPASNVTGTSTTLVAGVDGQTLAKTADFSLAITLKLTYTNV